MRPVDDHRRQAVCELADVIGDRAEINSFHSMTAPAFD
jgi:hypothetical protein